MAASSKGFGSGYYAFSENVLRGYVRLKAETGGSS